MGLGTTLKIAFDSKAVQRGLAGLSKRIQTMSVKFASMAGKFAVKTIVTGIAAATAGIIAFTASSSAAASNVESLSTQFTTLLGSTTLAKERMEEITKFAASTPFEIAELASTSKLLQTLGGDILATGEGLRLVGDAAALAGQPLTEVGLSIGRVFNAITSGTSAGEAVNRLQELGLITGKTKLAFEKLAAAQKKGAAQNLSGAQALKLLKEVMSQTEGGMAALAMTTEGKMSNMKDNISQLKVAFGTGFNDGLKVALDAVNESLPKFAEKFKRAGALIGAAITDAVNGDTAKLQAVGKLIGDIISAATKASIRTALGNSIPAMVNGFVDNLNPAGRISRAFGAKGTQPGDLISTPNFADMLKYEMGKIKISKQVGQAETTGLVPGTNGRFQYAPAGDYSSPFTDAKGNRVVEVLNRIEKNTQAGAKM